MAAPAAGSGGSAIYYDEEECLGFGVFVAELELVVGSSRDRRPDQVALLELLQKLQASIAATREPAALKQYQKRCEAALYSIVLKGACAAVRTLTGVCLVQLYTSGDLLPLFSRINGLQGFLQDKSNAAPEAVRLGVIDLLAHLTAHLGRCLASSAAESMAIAAKAHAAKGSGNATKAAALRLAAAVVDGLPPSDRNMAAVQAEAWKLFERQVKDKGSDELRAAAAALLGAMARAGGAFLWTCGGYYADEGLRTAVTGLDDAAKQPTREAFALALAELAAAARPGNPVLAAALEAEKKPARRQQLERVAGGMFKAALVQPFVEAAVARNQDAVTALALAWSSYAASLTSPAAWQAQAPAAAAGPSESEVLVELAVKAVAMLEQCSKAAADAARAGQAAGLEAADNIGACLAGGEMPAPTAAVIYFLRTAVIRRLPEPGQRQLLSALARAASHAIAPPVIVAAMEGCGVLLELLGEVHDEAAIKAVQNAALSKLSASSTAVRHQAAAVVAALALSSPPLLAALFGECLEGVETFCQQLMLLAAPYTRGRAAPLGVGSGAPPGGGSGTGTPRGAPDSQTKHCIDGLHGNALAVGALIVASARSALGAPSRLTSSVFWIAKRMISQPYCTCPWAVAAEREAGYILLGCMSAAAAPGLLAGRAKQQNVLELFSIALGPGAAEALTTGDTDGDLELAVACWWRAAALQALSAYVLGVIGKGLAEDAAQQVRLITAMLQPLLEAVASSPRLAQPALAAAAAAAAAGGQASAGGAPPSPTPGSSSGGAAAASGPSASGGSASAGAGPQGLSPVAAAAASLLQLRLLEVFFFLPAPQLWANCHAQLLQLCCRPLLAMRVRPDAAAAIAASSLKHMLNSQDALLGPWLPGRDMLEDELRTFVGEPGGPQPHPWEVGAAFTTGFITYSQALLPADDSEAAAAATAAAAAAAASSAGASTAAAAAAAAFANGSGGGGGGAAGAGPLGAAGGGAHSPDHHHASQLQQQAAQEQQRKQQGVDRVRLSRRFMPYPQPYALGPALLEAQMWLLGKLLSAVSSGSQMKVLEVMLSAVSVRPGQPPALRAAACMAVALAGLAGLGPLARRGAAGRDQLAGKVLQLASCMLEDQVSEPCLARAAAELMAAAACIGSAGLAASQAKAIADQLLAEAGAAARSGESAAAMGAGSSAELRSVLCLVLGAIHRACGGNGLQPTVPDTVEALVAVASRPVGVAHIWALHGLWLVAAAAGTGYAPHVKQSLQLALELLVSSFGDNPLLQPAAARLANAMIAVLGPQFTLGSAAYSRCKTLVTDNTGSLSAALAAAAAGSGAAAGQPAGSPAPSPLGGLGHAAGATQATGGGTDGLRGLATTWSELEQVLFAQQLILFAPDAVPAAKHLPLLLLTLTSSRPALRRAAAATLWHLADRDAAALAKECIEAHLLAALDGESEASTCTQIRATLTALMAASAPSRPGYWLKLLGAVALAAPPTPSAGHGGAAGASALRADSPDDDDDDGPPPASRPSATRSSSLGGAATAAGAAGAQSADAAAQAAAAAAALARLPPTPRLRTRLFAAELLLSLFDAVGPDARHKYPAPKYEAAASSSAPAAGAAAGGDGQDWLVCHLQPLVDLGFKLTTGSAESLRPSGAQLLQALLRFYGAVQDPDVPEMLLLEQYQAQFVAALRAALLPGAAPALAVCGGTLATSFLSAGLAAGDGAVMRRLMDLLIAPLQVWQALLYGGFAESVGVRARVALLQAHAQCANLAAAFGSRASRGAGEADDAAAAPLGCFSPNSSINNELCCSIVVKSQAPYQPMLLLLWWGVLLDCAAFGSRLPGFSQNHKSLLFGDTYPEVVEAVRGTYAAAWPPVLIALASNLPPAQQLAAAVAAGSASGASSGSGSASSSASGSGSQRLEQERQAAWSAFVDLVSSGADLPGASSASVNSSMALAVLGGSAADRAAGVWGKQLQLQCGRMYRMLLDVCLMLLCDSAAACAAALADAGSSGSDAAAARAEAGKHDSQQHEQEQQERRQQAMPAAVAAARRVAVSLQALQLLLSSEHIAAGLASVSVCLEVTGRLAALAVHVLLPWQQYALAQLDTRGQQPGGSSADAAADKVFGLVLLSAAELLQALAASQWEQQPEQEQQQDALLEALLALISIAVPFTVQRSGSSVSQAAGLEQEQQEQQQEQQSWSCYLPAMLQPLLPQQQQADSSSGPACCAPSVQAAAACSSLCQAAASLLQCCQQQQFAGAAAARYQAVAHLALRLLLTAAPGQQLMAAQKLLSSCWVLPQPPGSGGDAAAVQRAATAAAACDTLCEAVAAAVRQLAGSRASSCVADAAARLPVLLAALLAAASCCSSCADDSPAAAAAQRCCGVLLWALQQHCDSNQRQQQQLLQGRAAEGEGSAVVAQLVLEALRLLLQGAASQQQPGKAALARQATAGVVPLVAQLIHTSMAASREPLSGAPLSAVTESLKVLLLLSNQMAAQGEAAQVAIMRVLVPLLIEVAAPPAGVPVTPLLRNMACKLVSAMPASAAAAAFRAAVTALPAASKERLQGALREHAAEQAAAAASTGAGPGVTAAPAAAAAAPAPRKPAIALKMNFTLPR